MTIYERDGFEQVVGEKLRNAMLAKGLTVEELASQIGINYSKLNGKFDAVTAFFRPSELFRVCEALGVNVAKLFVEAWKEVTQ